MAELQGIVELIAKLGATSIIILVSVAVWRGWLVLPREKKNLEDQLAEEKERSKKWETLALRGTQLAATATTMAREASAQAAQASQPPLSPPAS